MGIRATGWDPYFAPAESLLPADVVSLGYVLNVIEDPSEREHTLQEAFTLARVALLIAVRIEQGIETVPGHEYGLTTERGTFQKYYTQREFLEYIERTLGLHMYTPALGIGYVFKEREAEQAYVSRGPSEQASSWTVPRTVLDSVDVGKRLPGSLYVHRSAENSLPCALRDILRAAKCIAGDRLYDVTKISCEGRSVSLLAYPGFDHVGHPVLASATRISLITCSVGFRSYATWANPPVLHRKETLVCPDYPRYAEFAALTHQEEEAGLLSSAAIGTLSGWCALLTERGYRVEGHMLLRTIRG
jgi:hypothetical protein